MSTIRLYDVDFASYVGREIDILGILTSVEMAKTKAGGDYAKLSIMDKSTQFICSVWDLELVHIPTVETYINKVIQINGRAKTFGPNNNISFNVSNVKMLTTEELANIGLTEEDFYNALENRAELAQTISNILDSIGDTIYGKIARRAIENNWTIFSKVAAGKSMHHTAVGGLMQHTVEVAMLANEMTNVANNLGYTNICKALVIAGAVLHDIGKCRELETNFIGNSEYTTESLLESHHISGINIVTEAAMQLDLHRTAECRELIHVIAAHHERMEWGQLKEPALIEAVLVSKADYISAMLNGTSKTITSVNPGEQYKGYGQNRNWVRSMGTYNNDIKI